MIELTTCLSLVTFVLSVVFLTWGFLKSNTSSNQSNLPPGPPTKFLLGNIHMLGGGGITLVHKMMDYVQKYGDHGLCTMYVLNRPIILITDFEIMKKVLHDDNFAGRPKGIRDFFYRRKGIFFTDGDLWKEHRRFALSTLRDLGMGKNWLQDLIIEEATALIDDIKSNESRPFDPTQILTTSVCNIICGLAYGERFEHNDEKFQRLTGMIGRNERLASRDKIVEFFPFLRLLPFSPFRARFLEVQRNRHEIVKFLRTLIREHKDTHGEKKDYISAFLDEANKQKANPMSTFTDDQLEISIFNLYGAGTETTSTTLAWTIIYLIKNPDVFKRLQKEVDSVLPAGAFPSMEDKDSLPFLQATIMEVQRMSNLGPIAVRTSIQASQINGYTIPADTLILPFLIAVHNDERYFPEPKKFNPDRFLDQTGKVRKIDAFMPFSVGKRYCIGESLAKMELFIFVTSIVRHFDITAAVGEELSTEDTVYSVVNAPKPFKVIFKTRS